MHQPHAARQTDYQVLATQSITEKVDSMTLPDPEFISSDIPVDLSNCDREPIHIPSSIQPQGMLLAARRSDFVVLYTSENSTELLGVPPAKILGQTLQQILGQEAVSSIVEAMGNEQYFPTNILTFTFPIRLGTRFDVFTHQNGDLLYVELELARKERHWDILSTQIEKAIRELRRPNTLAGLCHVIPRLIRRLTSYDRVMVYRFDGDGHGEVIAEEKDASMEPFLFLHYPASDIPAQARKLFLLQRLITIADVGYTPVRVVGHPDLANGEPLDMTYCGLRSVSPIHIEYLQNMGVGASLGISLIHNNKLWGMVLCHHRTSKTPPAEVRALCDLLGQLISMLLGTTLQAEESSARITKNSLLDALDVAIEGNESISAAVAEDVAGCLALVGATGALVRLGSQLRLIGETPDLVDSAALMYSIRSKMNEGVSWSDNVGALFPEFARLSSVASGALMIQVINEPNDGVLWFRGEVSRTVNWGGKPDVIKEIAEGSMRMSPRKSFASWKQVQHGCSLPWLPGEIEAARGVQRIITRSLLQRTEAQLAQLSRYDPLTNLPNRRVFLDRLMVWQNMAIESAASLLFLDLDDFKTVNDSLGHIVGDELLRQVGERLSSFAEDKRLIARLGGDEFVIFCEDMGIEEAESFAEKIVLGFKEPFVIDGMPFRTTMSIGVAPVSGVDTKDRTDPLRAADSAMYSAKQSGGNRVCVVEERHHEKVLRQLHLEQGLFHAVERGELLLEYQPQFACDTRQLLGLEALVRWRHPVYGLISPGEFIPLAEKSGQIVPIGNWVLQQATRQLHYWREHFDRKLTISVNVSAQQVFRSDFEQTIMDALASAEIPNSALCLEVTESMLLQDKAVVHLERVRLRGVRISVDDFGTGYSTLAYLQRLPIDEIKIDKSLLDDVGTEIRKAALYGAIVHMAHTIDATVIAEGVETELQWGCLQGLLCDGAQGFVLSKPLSILGVEALFSSPPLVVPEAA